MSNKSPLLAACALTLTTFLPGSSYAQTSCPNILTYGVHPPSARAVGETRRVRVTGVYFKTSDRGAFVAEDDDRTRSPGFRKMSSADFERRLTELARADGASVNAELTGSLLLGDTAELNLEQNARALSMDFGDLGSVRADPDRWFRLDRHTTLSVRLHEGEPFYRLMMLSSFVSVRPEGAQATVDLDSGMFLRPGETVVYKLFSDFEVARSGAERAHLAVTLRPY